MTTSVNAPLTKAEELFKTLIWDPMILAGESALFAAVPVLDAPILGTIDKAAINAASNWLYGQFVLLTDITTIKLLNSEAQTVFQNASELLAVIEIEKGIGSPEYAQAHATALADLSKFTRVHH